ncbi:IS5 family transposase [Tritonibacter scottomollicae]|uniref:IS5 family transposase n=1 Tax=Tritonibacter scottomollicae TaxID=483013 RepID=A0ABZ0HIV9_TRISK|nr:IS5 family transposase [Tritonibacter scottomollicae]WOI33826.1 IS5 family transposase [Tritonibacter scottomollicae]
MSRPPKTTYKTTHWKSYNQALRQRGSLTVWFDPSMQWEALPSGRRGRQQSYSDAAIQPCLTLKVLLGLPLRQATGFVASLLELSGLGWSVPDFSTLSRRQKALDVTIPYRGSKGALHLLVDSTGINVEGEGEWHTRKHPSHTCKHMLPGNGWLATQGWRKIHLGIDEETLEIRAVEVTSSNVGDVPMLPDLLAQVPAEEEIATVTADGANDTRACHDAIAARGAAAVIPPRRTARPWKPDTAGARARNEILRASKHLGRALWRNWSGYHRRSRVETKMNCVKLLGQRLVSRDFDRQVAEVQIRAAVMNRFTALGIPVTVALG